MKPYREMNSQEIDALRASNPAAYKAMIDEIDKVPVGFNAQGQRIFRNGQPVTEQGAVKYVNGVQVPQ
jgi:hypothetical protein